MGATSVAAYDVTVPEVLPVGVVTVPQVLLVGAATGRGVPTLSYAGARFLCVSFMYGIVYDTPSLHARTPGHFLSGSAPGDQCGPR